MIESQFGNEIPLAAVEVISTTCNFSLRSSNSERWYPINWLSKMPILERSTTPSSTNASLSAANAFLS